MPTHNRIRNFLEPREPEAVPFFEESYLRGVNDGKNSMRQINASACEAAYDAGFKAGRQHFKEDLRDKIATTGVVGVFILAVAACVVSSIWHKL